MLLDTKLDFQGHLKSMLNKVNKTIGFLCKLHNTLPRLPLLTVYRDHLWGLILAMGVSYAIGRGICAVQRGSGCGGRCGGACAGGLYGGLRWIAGYLGLALVFLWGGAQREEFNFCFSRFFC